MGVVSLCAGTYSRFPSFGSMGHTTSEGLSPSFGSWVASTPSKGGGQLRLAMCVWAGMRG